MPVLNQDVWTDKLYSGGWRDASVILDVTEPATGEVLTSVGEATADDVAEAVERAEAAQREWKATKFDDRATILRRAAAIIEENADELRDWIVRETGGTRPKAGFELHVATSELHEAAGMLSAPYGQLLPTEYAGRLSFTRRIPYGIVGVISPWNFPLILSIRSVAPALAVGNAVVLKPDPNTPVAGGFLIAAALEQAGLPDGVLHVLPGDAETGEAIVDHPQIPMISFTGSTEVGRKVGERAGRRNKHVALELGGNNALIVLEDADIDAASSAGAWGSFMHQGQICMTTGRHLVHERLVGDYLSMLTKRAENLPMGDPFREDVAIGPLINATQMDRVDGIVKDSVSAGARLETGGRGDGLFYRPTVLSAVSPAMRAFQEEIFGPVAPILTFSDEEEAIALANASDYGLTAAIQTRSMEHGLRVAEQIRAGMVHINDSTIDDEAHVPFGGIGASGNGSRFGGQANWEEFTVSQWVTVRDQQHEFPF